MEQDNSEGIVNFREILLTFGHSKEMKQRLSNGQIKINNQTIKSYDIDYKFDKNSYEELPDFLIKNIDLDMLSNFKNYLRINILDFFGNTTEESTNIESLKFLENYILLSISKKEHYVFKI